MANIATKILSGGSENNIFERLGIEEETDALAYTSLPAFEQKERGAYMSVVMHFRTKEDLEKFAALVEMPALPVECKGNKKSAWYPPLEAGERGRNTLCVWMDEDDLDLEALEE